MSAPKTDLEKQERRHKGPLLGMSTVVLFAAVLLIALIAYVSFRGNEPGDNDPINEEVGATGASPEVAPE